MFDEFEIKPISLILAAIGAFIGLFTANGGFNQAGFDPGAFVKLASAIGGGLIGFVWGSMMNE